MSATRQPEAARGEQQAATRRPSLLVLRYVVEWLLLFFVAIALIALALPAQPATALMDLARAGIIVLGAALPALVYGYFTRSRLPLYRREFLQNLRRLGLPENDPLYAEKFATLFGVKPDAADVEEFRPFSSPVLVATLFSLIGWLLVFFPRTTDPAILQPNPTPIAYGFLGAYLIGLGSLVRQYLTDDLQPRAYASITQRYLTVFVLSWVTSLILAQAGELAQGLSLVAAFAIGMFPSIGLRLIQRSLTTRALGADRVPFVEPHPLTLLDGMHPLQEDRLLLEGIDNIQNLTTINIVDLMLKTRFPVERIVDWIDQGLLYLHARDGYDAFRRAGLRTATDFLDAYDAPGALEEKRDRQRQALSQQLDAAARPAGAAASASPAPVFLDAIAVGLRNDPNLYHIRYWRAHQVDVLPEDIERERTLADLKLMRGLADEAIAIYDRVLHQYPAYRAGLLYRGLAYSMQQEYRTAIMDFTQALALGGEDWEAARFAYAERGRAHRELKEYEAAASDYGEALKVYANFPETQLDLAFVEMTYLGRYDEAIQHLDAVVESKFKEAEARANRGVARYERWKQQGRPADARLPELEQARADLERALQLKPDLIPFYVNLAHVQGKLGNRRAQENILNDALDRLREAPDALSEYRVRLERGYLYLQQGMHQQAADDFRSAAGRLPEHKTASVMLEIALGQQAIAEQAFSDAERHYSSALQTARDDDDATGQAWAHLGLGQAYAHQNDLPSARRELESAIRFAQDTSDAIYTDATCLLGTVALRLQDYAQAARHFYNSAVLYDVVLNQERASAEAYFLLGRARLYLNDLDGAQEALVQAREKLKAVFRPGSAEDKALQDGIDAEQAQVDLARSGARG